MDTNTQGSEEFLSWKTAKWALLALIPVTSLIVLTACNRSELCVRYRSSRQTRSYFTHLWDTVWIYIHQLFLQSKRAGSLPAPFLTDALSTSLKNELIEFRRFHCRSPQAWRNKRQQLIFIHKPTATNCFLSFYDFILFWYPHGSVVTDVVITQR